MLLDGLQTHFYSMQLDCRENSQWPTHKYTKAMFEYTLKPRFHEVIEDMKMLLDSTEL